MRVVHVDSAREWRGSQNQVLLLAQGMAARGHDVTVACRAGGRLEARARAAGLAVRPLVFGGDLALGAILGLARVLRTEAPDIVHAHDPHATSAGLLAAMPRVLEAVPAAGRAFRASGAPSQRSGDRPGRTPHESRRDPPGGACRRRFVGEWDWGSSSCRERATPWVEVSS